jgi:hypothetical protein
MSASTSTARRMWSLFEPLHAVAYFTDEPRAALTATGLRGFWRGYFAGRAAPLGRVGPAVVTSSFFGFSPGMVARAVPEVWDVASPEVILRARRVGAAAALRAILPPAALTDVRAALPLLRESVQSLDCSGRVLAAANLALPIPTDPYEQLWQLCTVLREHRGDGHLAALVCHGLDGCESLVWRGAIDLDRQVLQPARGWTDPEWASAADRLISRGWLSQDGSATPEGREGLALVERATDDAASGPWRALGPGRVDQLAQRLAVLHGPVTAVLPTPNPIGLPLQPAAGHRRGREPLEHQEE